MKSNIKRFFSLLKWSNLKAELNALGSDFTEKSLALLVIAFLLGIFITGSMLKLDIKYIVAACCILLVLIPYMVVLSFTATYEKIRFNNVVEYIEQLIYAFHKTNKINEALIDVYKVTRGDIKFTVGEMLDCINSEKIETNVYDKAFSIMFKRYKCSRVKILHDFLIECEQTGGDNSEALNMILSDTRSWAERTISYQSQRRKARNDVVASIFFSFITCGIITNILPEEYASKMIAMTAYQIGTFGAILFSIIIFVVVQALVSKSYLDIELDGDSSKYALKKRKYIEEYESRYQFKKVIIKTAILVVCIAAEIFFKLDYIYVIPTALFAMLIVVKDSMQKNQAVKVVTKELNMMFPTWIRILSLCLQTDNTHVAIQKSRKSCPDIMKKDLDNFIQDLANDPVGIEPYNKFLHQFNVPTLRLSINWLYSAAKFGAGDTLSQLDYLIEQNNQLTIAEEKIRNENALAGINMFVYSPMIIAVFELLLQMMLFISIFLGLIGSYA